MIVPDVNLLLYANNPVAREYTQSRNWVEAILTGNESVGFCWPVLCGFIRISTSSRALLDPLAMEEAIELVDDWIMRPHVMVIPPTERHWLILTKLLNEAKVRGPMTTDAEIAAYAIEYGAVLYTADREFSRYPGLRTCNPLGS